MGGFLDSQFRNAVHQALDAGRVEWRRHALERAIERGIETENILCTVRDGTVVENYPDSFPFPSALMLLWEGAVPLHVVAGFDVISRTVFVITAYEPDEEHFEADMSTRRRD